MVKSPSQYNFGLAYRYYLSLVTENIIKECKQVVGDFIRFLQTYLCLLCVYLFFDILWKDFVVFSFCPKNLFRAKCLKVFTVLDKILPFFSFDVVATTKILPIGV